MPSPSTHLSLFADLGESPDDDNVWTRFYDTYFPYAYSIARGCGLKQADALDVAQEAMLRCFRFISRYDRHRHFRPWFSTICRRLITDHQHNISKVPRATGDTTFQKQLNQLPSAAEGPLSQLLEKEAQDWNPALLKCIRVLLPARGNQQKIFDMHFVQGMSISEIAEELGISREAVSAAKHRMLELLRDSRETLEAVLSLEMNNTSPDSDADEMRRRLTDEQLEFYRLLQQGTSTREIADLLEKTPAAIRVMKHRVMKIVEELDPQLRSRTND